MSRNKGILEIQQEIENIQCTITMHWTIRLVTFNSLIFKKFQLKLLLSKIIKHNDDLYCMYLFSSSIKNLLSNCALSK